MTSREGVGKRFRDQLGTMISWALREDVSHVTPPSWVWGDIEERLHRRTEKRRSVWWRKFRVAYRSAVFWLLDMAVGPPKALVYCDNPDLGHVRETYYLHLLMYQNDLQLLLSQAA